VDFPAKMVDEEIRRLLESRLKIVASRISDLGS
jgi:hypothetical protein